MAPAKSPTAAAEPEAKARKEIELKRRLVPKPPRSSYPASYQTGGNQTSPAPIAGKKPPPKKATVPRRPKPKPLPDALAAVSTRPKKAAKENAPKKPATQPPKPKAVDAAKPKLPKPSQPRPALAKKVGGLLPQPGSKHPNPHPKGPKPNSALANNKHPNLHKGQHPPKSDSSHLYTPQQPTKQRFPPPTTANHKIIHPRPKPKALATKNPAKNNFKTNKFGEKGHNTPRATEKALRKNPPNPRNKTYPSTDTSKLTVSNQNSGPKPKSDDDEISGSSRPPQTLADLGSDSDTSSDDSLPSPTVTVDALENPAEEFIKAFESLDDRLVWSGSDSDESETEYPIGDGSDSEDSVNSDLSSEDSVNAELANDFGSNEGDSNDFGTNEGDSNDFGTNDFNSNDFGTNDFNSNDFSSNEESISDHSVSEDTINEDTVNEDSQEDFSEDCNEDSLEVYNEDSNEEPNEGSNEDSPAGLDDDPPNEHSLNDQATNGPVRDIKVLPTAAEALTASEDTGIASEPEQPALGSEHTVEPEGTSEVEGVASRDENSAPPLDPTKVSPSSPIPEHCQETLKDSSSCEILGSAISEDDETDYEARTLSETNDHDEDEHLSAEEIKQKYVAKLEGSLAKPPSFDWLTDLTADPRRYRATKDPVSKLRFSTTFEAKQVVLKLLAVFSNIRRTYCELKRRLYLTTRRAYLILTTSSDVRKIIDTMPSRQVATRCQIHWIFARAIDEYARNFQRPEAVPAKIVFAIERVVYEQIEELNGEELFCEYPNQKTMATFLQFRDSIDSVFKILFGHSPRVFMVASDLAYNLLATMDWEIYGEARDRLVNTAIDLMPNMRRYREFKECSDMLSSKLHEMCMVDLDRIVLVKKRTQNIAKSFQDANLQPDSPLEAYDAALHSGDAKHNQHLVNMRKNLGGGRIQRIYEQFMTAIVGGYDRAPTEEYKKLKAEFIQSLDRGQSLQ